MSLNRLFLVLSKTTSKLHLKRFITTTQYLRLKINPLSASSHHHHNHDSEASKNSIDEKLIAKLSAEDPLTDKTELDKHEWERKTRTVRLIHAII